MLPKKSEWKTMDDIEEEEEEEEDEDETGDEENDSEDCGSDDGEENNQHRKQTLVDFIDGMVDDEWSGNGSLLLARILRIIATENRGFSRYREFSVALK